MANRGFQNSETPEPTVTKFGTRSYVGNVSQYAKIQSDRPQCGRPDKWVK